MSHTKKPPRRRASAPMRKPGDTATIAWMLTVVTTLVCELLAFGSRVAIASLDNTAQDSLDMFGGLLLFAAIVTGTVSLLMLGVVLRVRREPQPRSILIAAVVIGLAPWLAALYLTV